MSTSKHIDKICIAVVAVTLALTVIFINGQSLGLVISSRTVKYESTLFDTSYVHQIDIVMNDWDSFIESCENEEYSTCTVVIDGEKHSNIAIRAKGNTSLSNVKSMNSQRYSFKLEFDHYESAKMLDGLDKLCLNNLIQDYTMMKDYIVYQLMNDFGVDSPLCSFAYLTVNGEDWGLYLAVEGIEDSFLSRNYGSDTGELYKPDSLSFGGGRGNGKDFSMDDFNTDNSSDNEANEGTQTEDKQTEDTTAAAAQQTEPAQTDTNKQSITPLSFTGGQGGQTPPEGFNPENMPEDFNPEDMPDDFQPGQTPPDGFQPGNVPNGDTSQLPAEQTTQSDNTGDVTKQTTQAEKTTETQQTTAQSEQTTVEEETTAQSTQPPAEPDSDTQSNDDRKTSGFSKENFGGMGSDDVKLKYIDDDADSYSNIFDNAKTDITSADKERLIQSLKKLSEYTELDSVVDIDEVIRYFVVHNFVCNGDSYTGSMIHNYYLHESDGKLGMIPWDYNLAFGTFQGGNASSTVNTSIDNPISGGNVDDRPMLGWIFSDESYTEQYHTLFLEFIEKWFTDGELEKMITDTADMIRPYVEKDPTKFCTTEEFESGIVAMKQFVSLRGEAVNLQLSGDDTAVETGSLNLSDMGSMGGGKGGNSGDGKNGGGMDFGGFDFDASSFIKLTDKDGNEVNISDLIDDISSIKSATLSDGTEIDFSSNDFSSMIKTDFSKIVSVTDKDGNVIDLSNYTISVNMPSFGDIENRPNMFGGGGFDGNESSDNSTPPQKPDGENESSDGSTPPQKPDGENESSDGSTPPQKPNGENESSDTQNTSDNGSDTAKTGSEETTAAQSEKTENSDNKQSGDTKSFKPSSMQDFNMSDSAQSRASDTTILILLGSSVLILALGILIAVKKKY